MKKLILAIFTLILMTDFSLSARAAEFPYAQGKVVGPVNNGEGSSYLLYLPKSLPTEREVPLLFYTDSDGGSSGLLQEIAEGAELTGWIMAISMESKNGLLVEDCVEFSRDSIDHILDTLPVDKDRIYFTGNSGGGAQAFRNASRINACGVMPNVGYLPSNCSKPSGECFIINGGWDFNRYTSANARKTIDKKAIHRFHRGGHVKAPSWLMVEGMLWLEGRYLAAKGQRVPAEQQFYEQSMVHWINGLKQTEPHRAFYWSLFLQDELSLSSKTRSVVKGLIKELGGDEVNRLYVEGLAAIDELSRKKLSRFGSGSLHEHSDDSVVKVCDELLELYKGVPLIEETLLALRKPTK